VKKNDVRILRKRERKLKKRLRRIRWKNQPMPMFRGRNIHYEIAERSRAIDCGGIGAFHVLARNTGLVSEIDENLHLLKRHLPYHESDHVLNIAYNVLSGGTCLDDIELRRNDETYMDALGAQRIPDPTTEGDFTRRFAESDVVTLMEAINTVRQKVWKKRLSKQEKREAIVDVDGIVSETTGECKEGMDISFKGIWGYHPLLVSLANTMEPLYLVNRSGNRPSHEGAVEWLDRTVSFLRGTFERVCLRGDTDFALTKHFDRWTDDDVSFAFGMDAKPNLKQIAGGLDECTWDLLERREKRSVKSPRREKPENVKERIVKEREYETIKLKSEHIAEVPYKPWWCSKTYRLIIVRKNLSVERGENVLFDDIRYFFYITNIEEMTAPEVVFFCNDRCNQENLIEQLKNGVNALRMPVRDLVSNWAYMVMASLAWTLKAWFALLVRYSCERDELLVMEFRRFQNAVVRIPTQIVQMGRQIRYRLLGYNDWLRMFLRTFDTIRNLRMT
jgi:hypothetical protein